MDKRFLSILGALIIIFVGIFIISQHSSNSPGSTGSNSSSKPTSHVEGQGTKGVTLVEYGDYQCPICGEFYLPVKQVAADNSQNLFFQSLNLPLASLHPNAI